MTDTEHNNRWVKTITISPPTLENNTADAERVVCALKKQFNSADIEIKMDLALLKKLPKLLRKCKDKVRCTFFRDGNIVFLINIAPPQAGTKPLGLAVDLGTTRVSLCLMDLSNGLTLKEGSFNNPQISIGPDILERIHFAEQEGGLKKINRLIINGLNQEIEKLCQSVNCMPADIQLVSLAGNTAMTHLFMGLNPRWIIREPYIPVINRPGLEKAADLGLEVGSGAMVFIFPNIGSYFGGDLIAGILFSGLNRRPETAILVDVGTNAEVVLGNESCLSAVPVPRGRLLREGSQRWV